MGLSVGEVKLLCVKIVTASERSWRSSCNDSNPWTDTVLWLTALCPLTLLVCVLMWMTQEIWSVMVAECVIITPETSLQTTTAAIAQLCKNWDIETSPKPSHDKFMCLLSLSPPLSVSSLFFCLPLSLFPDRHITYHFKYGYEAVSGRLHG